VGAARLRADPAKPLQQSAPEIIGHVHKRLRGRLGPAWQRSFAGGVVVVNPGTARATAQVGGHYLGGAARLVPLSSSRPRAGPPSDMVNRW
jgi:hypothetical protein